MDPSASSEEPLRNHIVGNALRHRWYLVVACMLVVGILASLAVFRGTAHYMSSATVVVQPTIGNALSPDATVNGQQVTVAMETESGLVDSPSVLAAVSHDLGASVSSLRSKVHAKVPPNTKFITISFRAANAKAAQAGAQAFAEAYLSFRSAQTASTVNRQLTQFNSQANQIHKQLDGLAGSHGSIATANRQVLQSRLATVQASISALHATDAYPGAVSTEATLPAGPAGLNPVIILIAGLLLGLGVGVAVAIAREATQDVVRMGDLVAPGGLPVLSELRPDKGAVPLLSVRADDAVEQGFRRLRVGIGATFPKARTICVAAASPQGSDVAVHVANLATVMSRVGLHVDVVDATGTHALQGLLEAAGTEAGKSGWELAGIAGPVLVVSHPKREGGPGYVDAEQLEELVTRRRDPGNYLLVAADSLTSADAEVAALASDCVLLVLEQERTKAGDVERVATRARVLGISFCGVLNVPRRGMRASREAKAASREKAKQPLGASVRRARRLRSADDSP